MSGKTFYAMLAVVTVVYSCCLFLVVKTRTCSRAVNDLGTTVGELDRKVTSLELEVDLLPGIPDPSSVEDLAERVSNLEQKVETMEVDMAEFKKVLVNSGLIYRESWDKQ